MGFRDELKSRAKTEEELACEKAAEQNKKMNDYAQSIYKQIQSSILSQASKAQYTYANGKKMISGKVSVYDLREYIEEVTQKEYTRQDAVQHSEPVRTYKKSFLGFDYPVMSKTTFAPFRYKEIGVRVKPANSNDMNYFMQRLTQLCEADSIEVELICEHTYSEISGGKCKTEDVRLPFTYIEKRLEILSMWPVHSIHLVIRYTTAVDE